MMLRISSVSRLASAVGGADLARVGDTLKGSLKTMVILLLMLLKRDSEDRRNCLLCTDLGSDRALLLFFMLCD